MVRKGDIFGLREWISSAPAVRGGTLASEALRQMKNTFIVTATLTSRSAIRGGMDIEEALSLSDSYIRKCEVLSTSEQITNLQYHMVLDYTERVGRVRYGKTPSRLISDVSSYVRRHMTERINVSELAGAMVITRTHLAAKFKSESGMTLTEFIMREKTEEAKKLLRYSDKSILAIGEYLAFSSHSHFTKAFKQYTGMTPSEYKNLRDNRG
jgi:AraC-like DNA-binding protein